MIHYRAIFLFIGWLLLILGMAMMLPLLFEYILKGSDQKAYAFSSVISLFSGGLLVSSNQGEQDLHIGRRDTFLLTFLSWIVMVAFAALPFLLSNTRFTITHAFFESVSGMTTTGATVLTHLDTLSPGILVWRCVLQWLGGIGIVVMALTVMTDLRIGGMELFHSESPDQAEKLFPRIRQTTSSILYSYIGITIAGIFCLYAMGLSILDAVCHTLSALSTGGFANYDLSIGYYNNLSLEVVLTLLMIVGGCTQLLLARVWIGKYEAFCQDSQLQAYLKILLFIVLTIALWRVLTSQNPSLAIVVHTLFNVTSVMTTTGFCSGDYTTWGPFAVILFFILPFIGGCTGSTTGGLKIFRLQVIVAVIVVQLKKLRRPHGIFLPKFQGKELSSSLIQSVAGFVVLFFFSCLVLSLVLGFLGLDFMTALSSACSMITNLGPGLGDIVGPHGTYAHLSTGVKWCLMLGMLLGRLELFTLYILFLPSFWRK